MDILKIVAFIIITLMIELTLEKVNKEYAILLTIVTSVMVLIFVVVKLDGIISLLDELVKKAWINKEYLTVLLKVTGIAYLVELTKNICVDAGNSSLASKVEMAGKISIVALTVPIITGVVSVIISIV